MAIAQRSAVMVVLVLTIAASAARAQSIETMAGAEGAFADVQFFREVVADSGITVFSRSRAEISYDNEVDLLSALYLSYSLPVGLGVTAVGRTSSGEIGGDAGMHFAFAGERLALFALLAAELRTEPGASFFALLRYRQPLSAGWLGYGSVETYSLWRRAGGHIVSVERARLGFEVRGWAFGAAINLAQPAGGAHGMNPGLFLRREL